MAESDEENPRTAPSIFSSSHPNPSSISGEVIPTDQDLSEETQDFRFLSALASVRTKTSVDSASISGSAASVIPRRGEKDFEPNPTKSQENALRASRQAMHDVLSGERVHGSKNWVVGYLTGRGATEGEGGEKGGDPEMKEGKRLQDCIVRVDQPRGPHFRTMGVGDSANRAWLLPEEALYLIERGTLDIRWGVPKDNEKEDQGKGTTRDHEDEDLEKAEGDDAPALSDLPMSLQGAYAMFISDQELTLARYTVFAGLRRLGYTVIRAPKWDGSPPSLRGPEEDTTGPNPTIPYEEIVSPSQPKNLQYQFNWPRLREFITKVFHLLFKQSPSKPYQRHPTSCPNLGPLVAPGLYRSYADIYRALTLIPFHDPLSRSRPSLSTTTLSSSTATISQPKAAAPATQTIQPFRIAYHVYKPTTFYRKTNPPPPDFYLAVIDARAHPAIPTLTELGTLLEEMPTHDPREDERLKKGRPEMRLKAGTRSVVLAVVDNGVVSFLRCGETGSGRERIFEGRAARAGGGKRGGGRGRGRGKGR